MQANYLKANCLKANWLQAKCLITCKQTNWKFKDVDQFLTCKQTAWKVKVVDHIIFWCVTRREMNIQFQPISKGTNFSIEIDYFWNSLCEFLISILNRNNNFIKITISSKSSKNIFQYYTTANRTFFISIIFLWISVFWFWKPFIRFCCGSKWLHRTRILLVKNGQYKKYMMVKNALMWFMVVKMV